MKPRHAAGLAVSMGTAAGLAAVLMIGARTGGPVGGPSAGYLNDSIADSGSVNVVTTVLLDYRAFDTLGEASVIFAAVAAVGALFAGSEFDRHGPGLSLIVRQWVGLLSALFWLFPVYIVMHGHLSPGGGFQGGVSLAVLIILLNVVFGSERGTAVLTPTRLHITESLSALGFLLAGLVGVVQGTAYLTNVAAGFDPGTAGRLLSGGAIPLLNLFIGCKVASGLGSIFLDLLSTGARS